LEEVRTAIYDYLGGAAEYAIFTKVGVVVVVVKMAIVVLVVMLVIRGGGEV